VTFTSEVNELADLSEDTLANHILIIPQAFKLKPEHLPSYRSHFNPWNGYIKQLQKGVMVTNYGFHLDEIIVF
jgi:hypothetical protein